MRLLKVILAAALIPPAFAADQPSQPAAPCATGAGAKGCGVSKKDFKEAREAFERGTKQQQARRTQEALDEFETATQLVPRNAEFLTAREVTRQQLVFEHMQKGNAELLAGRQAAAQAEFRSALHLDPQNEFAMQRLRDSLGNLKPALRVAPRMVAEASDIHLQPRPGTRDFHYRGDTRGLLTQIATAFGVTAIFDESVVSRPVRFDIGQVDFYTAMDVACNMAKAFWSPLSDQQMLLASNTPENRRQFERMGLRSFVIPGATTPQELTDVVNVLRNLFEIRFVTQEPATRSVTVRAPQRALDGATQFILDLDSSRPQVVLDVQVLQVDRSLIRDWGLDIPNSFQLINIPAGALLALGGQNIQDLINQLIAGGGINQSTSTAISALLAQLQGQQKSIFSTPLATFGGGTTLFGISMGTAVAHLALNDSYVTTLEHATLRAAQGDSATLHVGTRFPILNATFAPIFNSPAIAGAIADQSFQPAFPSFNYEDLGVNLKAKPIIHPTNEISLEVELQVRALSGTAVNGVPVISNREYKGSISLKDGEPAVVAGMVSVAEQRSAHGIPGFGQAPALSQVAAANNKQENDDELLVVITPHIVNASEASTTEIYLSPSR